MLPIPGLVDPLAGPAIDARHHEGGQQGNPTASLPADKPPPRRTGPTTDPAAGPLRPQDWPKSRNRHRRYIPKTRNGPTEVVDARATRLGDAVAPDRGACVP